MERYHKLNPERSAGLWISLLHRFGLRFAEQRLASKNVGRGQLFFLAELFDRDELSQEELAEALHMDKGTTARAVKALERSGYIVRVQDRRDKRKKRIRLTSKARTIETTLFETLLEWTELITRGLTPAEKRQSLYLLYRLAANAEAVSKTRSST
jgi:DNA-binding MarR family transcriptional regulator